MTTNSIAQQLLTKYPIISDQINARELAVILAELEALLVRGQQGNVVELGCYAGTTALFVRRLLDAYHSDAEHHVYDSFQGLPPKSAQDMSVAGDQFRTGELCAPRKLLVQHFKKAGLRLPVIHKGWFSDLTPHDVPPQVMFAFFDGDYYESIRDSFACVTPRLAPGAVIIVDDYTNEALPGARRATDEWAAQHGVAVRSVASLGIIRV